ncbi:hypothetical protein APHNP_0404 [Anaplasma phagocytophilum str. ApNP]|uniref:Uncharacterized protein n=2 Tax=Anaplasma phagocytophilum TaxID=948 RepID=A0A0F3NEU1_ANAPH|nr:hypothetical protein APHMUC_0607 [Anaplasma phagocytophilum str. ApMUC09]KJV66276.1 hypothetical protein APHNP_0404 [Anaplasma phagocytophilum str. ApNP]
MRRISICEEFHNCRTGSGSHDSDTLHRNNYWFARNAVLVLCFFKNALHAVNHEVVKA